jgi:hypothetical protein
MFYRGEVEHTVPIRNELPQHLEEIMACIEAISAQIDNRMINAITEQRRPS